MCASPTCRKFAPWLLCALWTASSGLAVGECSKGDEGHCAIAGGEAEESTLFIGDVGFEELSQALGRRPTSWKNKHIAPILASIGEGDYGEVARLRLVFRDEGRSAAAPASAAGAGAAPPQSAWVVKRVVPKSEEDVGSDERNLTEHWRFLEGFAVEAAAYESLAAPLGAAGLAMPKLLLATEPRPLGRPFTIIMEDLTERFPRGASGQVRRVHPKEREASLRWIAGFHAAFWENARAEERGLWRRGSFWIFDKLAQLEMREVPDGYSIPYLSADEVRRLRAAGPAIDARLAGRPAGTRHLDDAPAPRHRTLVHGDAKPENILCSPPDGTEVNCAGLDFGWVGEGYGTYDLIYMLWDVLATNQVEQLLQEYHEMLMARLPAGVGLEYTPAVMRQHFELCTLDFMRWMVGFRKLGREHFWAMPWAITVLREVLDKLDVGALLDSEEAYAEAVNREYPLAL
mmetsp:Transcript_119556/g.381484  ORF Transcript_119556/g.381484 Transcript_119556/m.381484 type:complete len:459 (+) Transcript_119556:36-1412(+)